MVERYNECWRVVQENQTDFNNWTSLLSVAEKLVRLGLALALS
jgi:hypothetical protein